MSYFILGFITGMSLILALGAQNIFVIEQGLKKEFVFIVCLICSISDFLLIFLGIFIFYYFQNFFTPLIEFILNFLLIVFLLHFILNKINISLNRFNLNIKKKKKSMFSIILRTLGLYKLYLFKSLIFITIEWFYRQTLFYPFQKPFFELN